jgi:SAM-dependent methyltransferase
MLTGGNAAKLYCLKLLAARAAAAGSFSILDLGCGDGRNFAELLRRHPHVRYVGVEPDPRTAARARQTLPGAEVIGGTAYDVRVGAFDAVVSFSVLEHVVHRRRYLEAARANVAATGQVIVNYDSGHFVADSGFRERAKGIAGRVLARAGVESHYQTFVREEEFRALAAAAGLRIVEARAFNTDVKRLYPLVREERREEFMERWLAFELELGGFVDYDDSLASIFRTRNFLLEPA